jgi:hypothetical protein
VLLEHPAMIEVIVSRTRDLFIEFFITCFVVNCKMTADTVTSQRSLGHQRPGFGSNLNSQILSFKPKLNAREPLDNPCSQEENRENQPHPAYMTGINPPIYGLLERYVLGCIGSLPPEQEARISERVQKTYRQRGDWRAILRGVLHIDDGVDDRLRQMWENFQKQAAQQNTQPDPVQFARLAVEDECFADLLKRHRRPETPIQVPMAPEVTVRAVGFWRGDYAASLAYPRPHSLVQRGWHASELKNIIAYLNSGYQAHPHWRYAGWSTCRFRRCGREGGPGEFNGCDELTDGKWGWPQGLAHYLEYHAVILPEEFVDTMRANDWRPPPSPDPPHETKFDYAFWIEWSGRSSRRGLFRCLPW